jgi:hypothetical protein
MRQYGVLYDVGRAMGSRSPNWRPDYTPALVRRELDIIHTELAANAIRICGRDLTRLVAATKHAATLGMHVWMCPELWNATPRQTLDYLAESAAAGTPLHERWPDQLTLSVGNELTLFMRGIVPGRNHATRSQPARLRETVLTGGHTAALRAFLTDAVVAVRRRYPGPISYCSLPFEDPDWDLFDIAAVNHYRQASPARRYQAVLKRLMTTGNRSPSPNSASPPAATPKTPRSSAHSTPPRSASSASASPPCADSRVHAYARSSHATKAPKPDYSSNSWKTSTKPAWTAPSSRASASRSHPTTTTPVTTSTPPLSASSAHCPTDDRARHTRTCHGNRNRPSTPSPNSIANNPDDTPHESNRSQRACKTDDVRSAEDADETNAAAGLDGLDEHWATGW